MDQNFYRKKISDYLHSRNVKKPSIRLNALENVFSYMESAKFIENGEVSFDVERSEMLDILTEKKKRNLNDAEKHVIKLLYDYYKKPSQASNTKEL